MNKAELVAELAPKVGITRKMALATIDGLVDIIVRSIEKGDSVTISGFGVFERKERAARVARNPRTGQSLTVEATSVPVFRPGHNFKAIIDGSVPIAQDRLAVRRQSSVISKTKDLSEEEKLDRDDFHASKSDFAKHELKSKKDKLKKKKKK